MTPNVVGWGVVTHTYFQFVQRYPPTLGGDLTQRGFLMDHTIISNTSMISAQGSAECRKYNKAIVLGGTWLWSTDENAGDHIYFCPNEKSRGFGGRIITFPLADGGEFKAQGPWHSNSDALLQSRSTDLTKKHLTWGVIATERKGDKYINAFHIDEQPVVGSFNRIEDLAEQFAEKLDKKLYYYNKSCGGSQAGYTNYVPKS